MDARRSHSFFSTLIRCTTRLICIGALAWLGLIVADASGSLNSLIGFKNISVGGSTAAVSIPDVLMPSDGYWSFTDSDLSIQKIYCDDAALQIQMDNMLIVQDSSAVSSLDASHLVALAKSNGAFRSDCPAGSIWISDYSNLRLRLVTTNSDRPCLVAAAFAIREDQQWQLTMLKPQWHESDHLLPLPADARTICTRRNEAGQLQLELVSTAQSSERLLTQWGSDGWDIRHTSWGSADSFSYLCARGDEVVYAWSNSAAGSRTIMLTASTSSGAKRASKPVQIESIGE